MNNFTASCLLGVWAGSVIVTWCAFGFWWAVGVFVLDCALMAIFVPDRWLADNSSKSNSKPKSYTQPSGGAPVRPVQRGHGVRDAAIGFMAYKMLADHDKHHGSDDDAADFDDFDRDDLETYQDLIQDEFDDMNMDDPDMYDDPDYYEDARD